MARSLKNKPNTEAPSADFPFGQIRNKSQNTVGTPVDKEVYQDLHNFFDKVMAEAGITHNEKFDNETDGQEFFEAFKKHIAPNKVADKTLATNSTTNLNEVQIDDKHTTAFRINNANGLEFQQITTSVNLEEFQEVVVTFEPATTVKESGGNLNFQNGALGRFEAYPGYPYKFRHINGEFYLESALHGFFRAGVLNYAPTGGSGTNGAAITFNSGWQENQALQVWEDAFGYVHLRGFLEVTSSPSNPVFSLASSYAPNSVIAFACVHPSGGGDPFFQLLIEPNGDATFVHNNGLNAGDTYQLGEIIYNPNI